MKLSKEREKGKGSERKTGKALERKTGIGIGEKKRKGIREKPRKLNCGEIRERDLESRTGKED
jgi:hypothetical protein